MIITEKAKEFFYKSQAEYIIINKKRDENFSGCGCSSESVVTLSPKVSLSYGKISEDYYTENVDGIKIAIEKSIFKTIRKNTKIDVVGFLSLKNLYIQNFIPIVIKQ